MPNGRAVTILLKRAHAADAGRGSIDRIIKMLQYDKIDVPTPPARITIDRILIPDGFQRFAQEDERFLFNIDDTPSVDLPTGRTAQIHQKRDGHFALAFVAPHIDSIRRVSAGAPVYKPADGSIQIQLFAVHLRVHPT